MRCRRSSGSNSRETSGLIYETVPKERQISQDDLFALAEWKAQNPDVPDGDWCKDFGTFKLCGKGRFPSTFLLRGQSARGRSL